MTVKQPDRHGAYVVFRVGQEDFALPIEQVNSIIRYEPPTPVPRAPEAVLGVINMRGSVIPVIDLARRFHKGSLVPDMFTRFIVSEGKVGPLALAVDAASEVVALDVDGIMPAPDGVLTPETARAFSGVVERDGKLVILLDLDEAVPASEYASALTDNTEVGTDVQGDSRRG